jgi:predicted DsbA family dithiol-disulfide isomerase
MTADSSAPSVHIEVVSDIVCPWCYIGKSRLEMVIWLNPNVAVDINWRPYFLNPWLPREGIDRQTYIETKFGSAERIQLDRRARRRRGRDGGIAVRA